MDIKSLIAKMTVEEKAALVSGHNFMYTNEIPSIGLPALECSDGPHGLRKQEAGGDNGVGGSLPSTAFPTAATTASGWNKENLKKIGSAIGEECRNYGVDVLLGPAVNIKRNPLCGRNFEYFSEDPYLTAEMGSALTDGVQSKGVGVSVKHFAANNYENYRNMGNSVVDERALREIYLKAFERIVKQSKPASLMCAYNQINGEFCSENHWLLTDVLRNEWGFDGIVMTDWGATRDRVQGVSAGLDLEMPGDTICRDWIISAVKEGRLKESDLDVIAGRMIEFVSKWHKDEKNSCDFKAHHNLAVDIAADCAVLLKNDNSLPLERNRSYLVVGSLFERMRYQGAGSSMICPTELVTPLNAFKQRNIDFEYVKGYTESNTQPETNLITEAVSSSQGYETVLVFAGLTDFAESEGGDRAHMRLPENQLALIDALVKTGKKVIVILYGGSPVELPFENSVSAILNMYLPGQGGGEATARLLFGETNPSGKLAETWALSYADVPFGEEYSKKVNELYKESIFVGYRYYETAKKKVRYPFGYGLSYTTFEYSDLSIEETDEDVTVKCTVTNTGKCDGAEIVQLYTGAPESAGGYFAVKELRSFDKIYLAAGQSKPASLTFRKSDLQYFDLSRKTWKIADGVYSIYVGASVRDIRLKGSIRIDGQPVQFKQSVYTERNFDKIDNKAFAELIGKALPKEPKVKPYTLETRLDLYKKSYNGRRLLQSLIDPCDQMKQAAEQMPEGVERDNLLKGAMFLEKLMCSNSARSLSMSASGDMPYNMAKAFVALANGNLFEGIELMGTPDGASPLPADKK